jgi:carboxymethylenebutenolidase
VKSTGFVLPGDENFNYASAALAHTRSLTFLKPIIGGPFFDLEAIWKEYTYYEFDGRSVAKAMATMVQEPYMNHIPTVSLKWKQVEICHY